MNLLDILRAPWAIEPDKLHELQAIYAVHLRGEKLDIAGIEASLGRPLANEQQDYELHDGGVATLAIDGVLAPKANLLMRVSGGASAQMLMQQVASMQADPRVRSAVLVIDSPGGSVNGSPELAAAVAELAAVKPVVALGTAMMASAAYWIASSANAVFITGPTVAVGSIGIVATHEFNPRADGRVQTEITAGKYKRIATGAAPLTADGKAYLQGQVDHLYEVFVDAVAVNRGVSTEQVLEHMADGRVFIGRQAIDAGLVDGVSTLDALIAQLAADPAVYASRRKARVPAVPPKSKSAGAAPEDKPPTVKKGTAMSESLTRASFEQDHAPLFAQLREEFTASGQAAGAQAERERIQGVFAVGTDLPGHEAVLKNLAFDGKTTGPEAAMAVLKAEGAARAAAIKAHTEDAPAAAPAAAAPADKPVLTKAEQVEQAKAYAKEHSTDFVAALKHLGFAA